MTIVQTPPSPPSTPDPDIDAGVIEDARKRQRRHRRIAGLLIAAAVAAGALIVGFGGGGGASGAGGHAAGDPSGSGPATSVAASRVNQQLTSILAVLRRPQTALDRKVFAQSGLADRPPIFTLILGEVDPASARVATITPWGSRVLLALTEPPTAAQSHAAARATVRRMGSSPRGLQPDHVERLILFANHGWGGGGTVNTVEAGKSMQTEGWGTSYAGGSTGTRAYVVVPNGVARVTFVLPQSAAGRSQGPQYAQPLRLTVPVHGNIAAFEARRSTRGSIPMIWYAANGHVIKQIGDVAANTTVQPVVHPKPTPATAASRAAELNPATPNQVTITPRTGSPTTTFQINWRLLLTGADYQFDPVGPQGSKCYGANAIPGGLGGGTTDVRGQLYGEALGPLPPQGWCPGTYRVSVNVLDLGAGRSAVSPVPQAFGSATFTVKP